MIAPSKIAIADAWDVYTVCHTYRCVADGRCLESLEVSGIHAFASAVAGVPVATGGAANANDEFKGISRDSVPWIDIDRRSDDTLTVAEFSRERPAFRTSTVEKPGGAT